MRWLVVGCGSIGLQHLGYLKDAGEHDVAVIEPNLARRQLAVPFTGQKKAVASWDDAPAADVALICTPTHRHVADANTALDQKLHLIIEKPVSYNAIGGQELHQRLGKDDTRLAMVSCPYRFHPGAIRIKEIVANKELGTIFFARSWYRQALDEWRPDQDYRQTYSAKKDDGGGLFLDRIHELDMMRWLFGEPVQVRATIAHTDHFETDIEHTAFAMLLHAPTPDGEKMMATVGLDCLTPGYHCGLELMGTKGQMGCDFAPTVNGEVQRQGIVMGFQAQTRHWLDVLRGQADPEQDVLAAYRVLKTAMTLYESAKVGTWLPND